MPTGEPDGYLFVSQQEHLVAQARLDGFTLSRLQPYHDGQTFLNQARELWQSYVAAAHPFAVKRLAMRNVNRIEMPLGTEIQRYILTCPEIARALPQEMLNFFLNIVIPDAASGAIAAINQTFAQADPERSVIPLIFDVEASREVKMDTDSAEIWEVLAQLRVLKNRIFFRSLTVEALERYR